MEDDRCIWFKKKLRCFKSVDSSSAFNESKHFFVSTIEDLKNSNPFSMENKCNVQGKECFSRSLRIGSSFLIIYLLSGLIVNFLHELFHYTMLFFVGITGSSFTFSANLGFTMTVLPPYDASIHWTWWFLETLGPLLLVNSTIVIMTLSIVNHDVKNPPYADTTFSQKMSWVKVNFLKALAFTSAMAILMNTILSPFYNMYYALIGMGARTSDLSWAWSIAVQIPEPGGTWMRIAIFVSAFTMIAVTIVFVLLFNRRETER